VCWAQHTQSRAGPDQLQITFGVLCARWLRDRRPVVSAQYADPSTLKTQIETLRQCSVLRSIGRQRYGYPSAHHWRTGAASLDWHHGVRRPRYPGVLVRRGKRNLVEITAAILSR
jgi:hypothetical protein